MLLDIQLSTQQIKQIAKMLSLNLEDIKNYIDTHKEENKQFLKEEQKNVKDKKDTNDNSVWTVYTDDTICKVKIDTYKKDGGV